MKGRLLISFAVLLSLTSSLGTQRSVAKSRQVARSARPPNILLIVPDDQGLRTMAAMPRASAWFGESATAFPNAYVTTPLCCPSRSSILTGRYAHNHRVRRNKEVMSLDTRSLIQRGLQDSGYRTGVYGKFLNSWDVELDPPYFDDWAMIPKSKHGYTNGLWNINGELQNVTRYGTRFVGDRTIRFIESNEERDPQPWFAYVSPPAPHPPFTPEPRYSDAVVPAWPGDASNHESDPLVDTWMRTDKPAYVRDSDNDLSEGQSVREQQFRTLMTLDDVVAEIRDTLEVHDELDETLVVYFSDNGFMWSQHGLTGKNVPYLEAIRVPAFIKWPSKSAQYATDDRLVANIDIAPTILDAAGIPTERRTAMDGRSLLDPTWNRAKLLIEAWSSGDVTTWAGLVSSEWSYVEYYDGDDVTETFREYYDLLEDPYQMNNLLGDPPPMNDPSVNALSADLAQARSCLGPDECP